MDKPNIKLLVDLDLTISSIQFAFEKKCPVNWCLEQKENRSSHAIVFVLGGSAVYHTPDNVFTVKKHDILYLAKGSKYLTLGNGNDQYHFIVVSFLLTNDDALYPLPLRIVTRPKNPAFYISMFSELSIKWLYKGVVYKLKCKSILSDILFHLVQDTVQDHLEFNNLTRIQPAAEHMERYFYKSITILELSKIVNLSESHFRRLFKQIYGIPPHEYLDNIRISRAKDLIKSGMYSIQETAEKTGYSNIYYFSRAFKKITGVSPSTYRIE